MSNFYRIEREVNAKAIDIIDNSFHDGLKEKIAQEKFNDFMRYIERNIKDIDIINKYLTVLINQKDIEIDAMIWNYYFYDDSIYLKTIIKDIALESIKQRRLSDEDKIIYNVSHEYKYKDITLTPMNKSDSIKLIEAFDSEHLINVEVGLRFNKSIEDFNIKGKYMFSIYNDSNELVGETALYSEDDLNFNIEYYINPKYRKLGYGEKAAGAITKMAFNNKIITLQPDELFENRYNPKPIDIKLLFAPPDVNNIGSNKILQNNGFSKDCLIVSCKENGEYKFANRYTLLKEDYLNRKE